MEKDKCQCIIHYAACHDKDDEHPVSPKDISSWSALLEAAKVRNHQPVLDVAKTVDENHILNIVYHRKCRSLFIMKRDWTEKLETFMSCKGEVLKTATKKSIRRRLESELGDSVHIFVNNSGKLLLVPDSLSFKDVVLDNENLRKELAIWKVKLTDANKITDQASSQIREAIRRDMTPTPWPYHPSDLSNAVNMPTQLHRFLVGLLTGNPENENPSERVSNLVQSFGQDLIYAVTCGQHKSPKHVLLPYAVKTLNQGT